MGIIKLLPPMKSILPIVIMLFQFNTSFAQLQGLVISGDPESLNGATWTYQNTVNGVVYNLQGVLLKPNKKGIFPVVIINHGTGGNATGYSRTVAKVMVTWGFVCIATNYTHSGGVPCGSPGQCIESEFGASQNNILRAMKCRDIIASLRYADTNHVLAFGHSRGAFLTTAIVGAHPDKFSGAGHTAGGVSTISGTTAPDTSIANDITVPYIIHHGDADSVVNILMDSKLQSILEKNSVSSKFIVYRGYNHNDVRFDPQVYSTTRAFFDRHCIGLDASGDQHTSNSAESFSDNDNSLFELNENVRLEVYNILGQRMNLSNSGNEIRFLQSNLPNGIYFLKIFNKGKFTFRKILKLN